MIFNMIKVRVFVHFSYSFLYNPIHIILVSCTQELDSVKKITHERSPKRVQPW